MSDTANRRSQDQSLLSVRSLSVEFGTGSGAFKAVKDVSFDVQPGRTLAVVGESGSGKSVTSLAIMRLTDYTGGGITSGQVLFRPDGGEAIDLVKASDSKLREIRGNDIAMIFQEPMTSLNPVFTIGNQISETLILHQGLNGRDARLRAKDLLQKVRLPDADRLLDRYPHQLSGGMRQRVMIAMALACNPKLLIADEPTTALDVTIQAQILNLLRELVAEENAALILITHDLGVVAGMCERVNVMYSGLFMETGSARQLFEHPRHPYTLVLLQSIPRLDAARKTKLHPIPGNPRDALAPPAFCPFQPRCSYEVDQSREEVPALLEIEPGHAVACFNPVPEEEWQQVREAVVAS
jgi:glutathione transport system ATP-binding protein